MKADVALIETRDRVKGCGVEQAQQRVCLFFLLGQGHDAECYIVHAGGLVKNLSQIEFAVLVAEVAHCSGGHRHTVGGEHSQDGVLTELVSCVFGCCFLEIAVLIDGINAFGSQELVVERVYFVDGICLVLCGGGQIYDDIRNQAFLFIKLEGALALVVYFFVVGIGDGLLGICIGYGCVLFCDIIESRCHGAVVVYGAGVYLIGCEQAVGEGHVRVGLEPFGDVIFGFYPGALECCGQFGVKLILGGVVHCVIECLGVGDAGLHEALGIDAGVLRQLVQNVDALLAITQHDGG